MGSAARHVYRGRYINSIPENYFSDYLKRVEAHVENKKGNLHAAKSTEWSRLILPLTAMGYDIRSVAAMILLKNYLIHSVFRIARALTVRSGRSFP